jgi:hypothetical protein
MDVCNGRRVCSSEKRVSGLRIFFAVYLSSPQIHCIMYTTTETAAIDHAIRSHIAYAHPHVTGLDETRRGRALFTLYSGYRVYCKESWEALLNARALDDRWPNTLWSESHIRTTPFHRAFESCVREQLPTNWKYVWNAYSTDTYDPWDSLLSDSFGPSKSKN